VLGLGLAHTGAHIVSAAVEAVCFQLAGGLAELEAGAAAAAPDGDAHEPLEVVGNGGVLERSPLWQHRLAAVLGRSVTAPVVRETTARGSAAAALGVSLGSRNGAPSPEVTVVVPEPADVAVMADARRRWLAAYERLLPVVAGPPVAAQRAQYGPD
jgi:sugar (pentulose or hexulose) kinase